VFIAFAVSTHSATLAVLLALGAATLMLGLFRAKLVPRNGLPPMIASMILGVVMLLTTNYALSGTFAWTPGGYGLAFRPHAAGRCDALSERPCPNPHLKLCPYRSQLPLGSTAAKPLKSPRNRDIFQEKQGDYCGKTSNYDEGLGI
jgi:hypothetical protein